MRRDCEVIGATNGSIIKIWRNGLFPNDVMEIYENRIEGRSSKGINMHTEADLVLFPSSGAVIIRTYSYPDMRIIEECRFNAGESVFQIKHGTPFSFHNHGDETISVLVLSSHLHRPSELVKIEMT